MMFLNIVTPCSRPENLHTISKSINIPADHYKWWVVFDAHDLPDRTLIPNNCEPLLHAGGQAGHMQRNYAIDKIHTGHVYMNDDDTVIHAQLWSHVQHLHHDLISFRQNDVHGNLRLMGDKLKTNCIDSHNFMVSRDIIGDTRWGNTYAADGRFAQCMQDKVNANGAFTACYIPEVLSVYNALR
jgi:hypothetical protein